MNPPSVGNSDYVTKPSTFGVFGRLDAIGAIKFSHFLCILTVVDKFKSCEQLHTTLGLEQGKWQPSRDIEWMSGWETESWELEEDRHQP